MSPGSSGQGPVDAAFDPGHGLFFSTRSVETGNPIYAVQCDYYNIFVRVCRATHFMHNI